MENYEKRGYLLENYRLFHLRSEGATNVDSHYHEFCKLLLLLSGQGSYYVDGQHYLLRPGDIVLIDSHSIHKPELGGAVPYERIILYVSPDYLRQLSTPGCDLPELFRPAAGHVLRLKDPKPIFALATELERGLSQEGFGREQLSDANLLRLLVALGRALERREAGEGTPTAPENKRVLEIMEYLDRSLAEPIDMDHLAEIFYVSKYHMMRAFREQTGTTIYTYLTRRRLALARERLEAGMSATECCYSCGFRSYSSFTRAWGKYYGTTPTGRADRKLVRAEDYE